MEHAPYPSNRYAKLLRVGKGLAAVVLAAGVVAGSVYAAQRFSEPTSAFALTPAWEQNFATQPDGAPDPNIWRYDLDPAVPGWNEEKQAYTTNQRNVRIEGGKLILQAHREPYQYPNDPEKNNYSFTSGRIDTKGKVSFLYGKIEARMKLPEGGGAWPAFWLLSATNSYTQGLSEEELAAEGAYSRDGEIDIMENAANDGCEVWSTVYTFNTYKNPVSDSTIVPNCTTEFHTYSLEWKPGNLAFLVDNKPFLTVKKTASGSNNWPFDKPTYLILNLAVGGKMGGAIDPATQQWTAEVSRVSYYPYQQ